MSVAASIGDIDVNIIGDWSDLQAAIDAAVAASQAGGQEIAGAFTAAAQDAGGLGAAASEATPQVEGLGQAAQQAGEGAHEGAGAFEGFGESLNLAAEFAGFNVGLEQIVETLKEFVTEAVETYAAVQRVETSLTALTGSGEVAAGMIEDLKALALSDALSFPSLAQAAQRMTALGFSTEETMTTLQAAADASRALGTDFTTVADTIDRIGLSGNAMGRTLASLGLTTDDLAKVLGVADDQVKNLFKSMDVADRVEALDLALQKFAGTAQATAGDLAGTWQNAKTQFEFAAEELGNALAPAIITVLNAIQPLIPLIGQAAGLVKPLADAVVEAAGAFSVLKTTVAEVLSPLKELTGTGGLGIKWTDFIPPLQQFVAEWKALAEAATLAAAAIRAYKNNTDIGTELDYIREHMAAVSAGFWDQKQKTDQTGESVEQFRTRIAGLGNTLTQTTSATVSTIAQLKELGLIGETNPFKTLDDSAQKAFDQFQRGFAGLDEQWNEAAAGINVSKLYDEFIRLQAEMVQAGAQGSLGFAQVSDALKILNDYVLQNGVGLEKVTADVDKNIQKQIDDWDKLAGKIGDVPPAMGGVTDAMVKLQDQTTKNQQQYQDLLTAYVQLVNWGTLSGSQVEEAYKQLETAAKNAGVSVQELTTDIQGTEIELGNLPVLTQAQISATDQMREHFLTATTAGKSMGQEIGQAIDRDLAKGISDVILQTGNLSQAFTKLGQDVLDVILNKLIKQGIDALMSKLSDLGGMWTKIFGPSGGGGGGGGGGGAGLPLPGGGGGGGVSSAVGGALSGAMGMVGAIGAVGSFVTGVIGDIQNAHQTDILRSIELNTRETAMFIGGLGGGGVQDWLHIIAVNTTPLLNINTWIHDAWVGLLSDTDNINTNIKKLATMPLTVNITINGAQSPQQTAQAVASYLKNVSPAFSP